MFTLSSQYLIKRLQNYYKHCIPIASRPVFGRLEFIIFPQTKHFQDTKTDNPSAGSVLSTMR